MRRFASGASPADATQVVPVPRSFGRRRRRPLWADGSDVVHVVPNSRNLPAEFAETRYPVLVEQLALRTNSGGAGYRRGGLGYDKHFRALVDCRPISLPTAAARLLRRQWRQGRPAVLRHRRHRRRTTTSAAWSTATRCSAGQIVRVVTTGGGGWGDPLEREVELVQRDVIEGRFRSARRARTMAWCSTATSKPARERRGDSRVAREAQGRARGAPPMIDRGAGFEKMIRGEVKPWMRS